MAVERGEVGQRVELEPVRGEPAVDDPVLACHVGRRKGHRVLGEVRDVRRQHPEERERPATVVDVGVRGHVAEDELDRGAPPGRQGADRREGVVERRAVLGGRLRPEAARRLRGTEPGQRRVGGLPRLSRDDLAELGRGGRSGDPVREERVVRLEGAHRGSRSRAECAVGDRLGVAERGERVLEVADGDAAVAGAEHRIRRRVRHRGRSSGRGRRGHRSRGGLSAGADGPPRERTTYASATRTRSPIAAPRASGP